MEEFFSSAFMPHGHCYLWKPELVWLMVASNFLIGLSYVSISSTLGYIVRKIKHLPFQGLFLAFGLFIITCGLTHFIDILTVWHPYYWVDATMRAICAISSVVTAILLIPFVPRIIDFAETTRRMHEQGAHRLHRTLAMTKTVVWEWDVVENVITSTDNIPDVYGADTRTVEEGFRLVHPDDIADRQVEVFRVATYGGVYHSEFRIVTPMGVIWLEERATANVDVNGKVTSLVGVVIDVTSRKQAEAALKAKDTERENLLLGLQQAVRSRDEFLSVASHEFRTPLTTIMLQVHGLRSAVRAESPALVERCNKLQRQAERLEGLVSKLLEVSRIRASHPDLDLEPNDLGAIVVEVVEETLIRQRVESDRILLQVEAGVVGQWDRIRLIQVVTNLLTNAIKYGEGKPIEVSVRSDGPDALLVVKDDGMGIDPVDHDRIFKRFERAVSEHNYGGLGLGLWISKEIVKALQGTLLVESQLGAGAAFTVRIPKVPA